VDLKAKRAVSESEARAWARRFNFEYYECSALTGQGISMAMDHIINIAEGSISKSNVTLPERPKVDWGDTSFPSSSSSSAYAGGGGSRTKERVAVPPTDTSALLPAIAGMGLRALKEELSRYNVCVCMGSGGFIYIYIQIFMCVCVCVCVAHIHRYNVSYADCLEKSDFVARLEEARAMRADHKQKQAEKVCMNVRVRLCACVCVCNV
jgi:hypothetical protein